MRSRGFFALAQGSAHENLQDFGERRQPMESAMSSAQIGLSVTAPIIVGFALLLYRIGVLQRTGAASAILVSIAIAAVLFFNQ
ncbi:hypothetical protein EN788_64240 [Mesorhizobium sp. M2D.F.Ca.ET.145.01.1.1]|nr:hypothetical protein EN788_64240 [Mesorhizobium sp. M2D.F.Ca.ET.145.01.1.1]